MISRFNQLLLAFTIVTPLLLSIAIVLVCLYSSGYGCEWSGLICLGIIPKSLYWWIPNIFVLVFLSSLFWAKWFLKKLIIQKRGERSIILTSLQNTTTNNMLPVVAMLPPWITLLLKDEAMVVLVSTILVSLGIAFFVSRQGYTSLIFLLCGYKRYEGEILNGMKIQLLSKRVWRCHKDIRRIVMLSDNFALVV